MISEQVKNEIEEALLQYFESHSEFQWVNLDKGYFNNNQVIKGNNSEPLAVCKYFPDDSIFKSEDRMEREIKALKLFGGSYSPNLIWMKKPNLIVYEYIEGIELLNIEITKPLTKKISKTLTALHDEARLYLGPSREQVIEYYRNLISIYRSSSLVYPKDLINELVLSVEKQEEILDQYKENLTFVHGDLVPPNFIINKQIKLIDWEFFRPELEFFDYQYFNYYATAHNLKISLKVPEEIREFYNNLVDVLEKLWRFGYLKKNKEIFYSID